MPVTLERERERERDRRRANDLSIILLSQLQIKFISSDWFKILWRIWCFLRNDSQNARYIRCEHCYGTASGKNTGKNDSRHNIRTINRYLKKLATFKQFRLIYDEIKKRVDSWSAYYHSYILSKIKKIKMHKCYCTCRFIGVWTVLSHSAGQI
jgi:hypothetical protein